MGKTLRYCTGAGIASLLMLPILAAPARAQDNPQDRPPNSLRDGAHALQFQFSNWTLRSLQGATLAYKWHFSDRSAWRIGVSTNLDFSDSKQINSSGDTVTTFGNWTQDGQSVGLSWHYMRYSEHRGRLSSLLETGPSVTWGHGHSKSPGTNSSKSTSWNIGWAAALGAEWFATPSVSVMSQYGLSLSYGYLKSSLDLSPDGRAATRVTHAYQLDSLPITVGVSLYF